MNDEKYRRFARRVVVESPFAGDRDTNVEYAIACMRDCLSRNEAPIASHLLYTLPGLYDDSVPEQRELGILAGLSWAVCSHATAVYYDLGITDGMKWGVAACLRQGRALEYRTLHPEKHGEVWQFAYDTTMAIQKEMADGKFGL